jgi:exodeoxyribonuclease VII small subunit
MAKKKAAAAGAPAPAFEESLARLESIVRELEEEDLPLERSLAVFEEGVRLSRLLHERLNEAERKVEVLMKNADGEKVAAPFAAGGEPAAARAAAADDDGGDDEDDEDDGGDEETGGAAGGTGQSTLPF